MQTFLITQQPSKLHCAINRCFYNVLLAKASACDIMKTPQPKQLSIIAPRFHKILFLWLDERTSY
jgi:hypothetical protein